MIKFHFCKTYNKKVKGQSFEKGIKQKFEELGARNHLVQSGKLYDYKNGLYVLETKRPMAKIIIHEDNIEGENIFFVRDIITIKDENYVFGTRIHPLLKSGIWSVSNPIPLEDKESYIKETRTRKDLLIKKSDDLPPFELTNWLNEYQLEINYDVFETKNWVSYAMNSSVHDGMSDENVKMFGVLIQKIINDSNSFDKEIIKSGEFDIQTAIDGNFGIIYSLHQVDSNNKLMLYNAAYIKKQKEHWEKSIAFVLENDLEIENSIDGLTRFAYRAYPKWTVSDDEIWFSIQKNDEYSNLSLTQDQLNFFKTFKFPYYINGQAGSGKSTMLYYLFANAFYFKCQDYISGKLLFITENKSLLEHTQKSVFDLINNNPEFDGIGSDKMSEMDDQFHAFKEFLLNLIPEEDKTLFINNKYLSYSKFTRLYENSYLRESVKAKYSAEESWFTIITYIYGYDSDKRITSDNYQTIIPAKSRKIPLEKFKGIEKDVLPFYEKLINEDQYWDKLKVIRFLECNETPIPKYSLIICDEAQDFCRVELRFILKLSEYLDYNLSSLKEIPIVFAGDPNQTVNPTGFREREMTEMLHTELGELASFNYNNEDSVYNPLFNYRSPLQVVSLANFIQNYRKKNFDIRLVHPQIPKLPNTSPELIANTFLDYETIENVEGLKDDLINKVKYKIFVVPVDATQKENFIKGDSILEDVNGVEIKTAVETKGAEYNQVVLYGFGEYYIKEFGELNHDSKVDEDEIFRQAYFFNKLYVGITRAQSELLIIDSKESQDLFWKKIVNNIGTISGNWESLNKWKEKTIEFNPDTVSNVIQSNEENAKENALQDKYQGVYEENPARLRVAANQFYKLGNKIEYFSCLAMSEELKEKWLEAGKLFMRKELLPKSYEDAARCFFKGQFFEELFNNVGSRLKSSNQDVRLIISGFMESSKLTDKDITTLNNNRQALRSEIKSINWRREFVDKLIQNHHSERDTDILEELSEVYKTIVNEKDLKLWPIIGELNYNLNNFVEAIQAWDRIDSLDTIEYVQSKVKVSRRNKDIQSELTWLNKLKTYKTSTEEKDTIDREIIEKYKKNKETNVELHPDYIFAIFSAYIYLEPENDVHLLGEQAEILFKNNLKNLLDSYQNLLSDTRINSKIKSYILKRWVKTNYKINLKIDRNPNWIIDFNKEIQEITQKYKLAFKKYTIEELENINEYPDSLVLIPGRHLQNLNITNFKRFTNLNLNNLGQFNLIVGDNNVGKTSVLEALMFDPNKDIYLKNLAVAYQERMNLPRIIDEFLNEKFAIPVSFPNTFLNSENQDQSIKYLITEDRTEWEYEISPLSLDKLKFLLSQNSGIDKNEYYGFRVGNKIEYVELPLILKNIVASDSLLHPLIPFGKGYNKQLAQVYSTNIEKIKSVRNTFMDNMKIFIPNIERIIVDTESGSITIEEFDKDQGVELNSFGEGANKLFRILVQLTLHKGGRLLIDEIDAGIHHSRFKGFWETILKFSKINDTQIFATTHNLECIKSFNELLDETQFESYRKDSRVITLRELPNKNIKAYTRIYNEFHYELTNNIELRGEGISE